MGDSVQESTSSSARRSADRPRSHAPRSASPGDGRGRPGDPATLEAWIRGRSPSLVERWTGELRSRPAASADVVRLAGDFCTFLLRCVAGSLGPFRDQVEPLLVQGAELYGCLAALRGLAAGEAVEEAQLLREVVIRFLYQDPPAARGTVLSLRDVLRVNRALDRVVSQASVGHTDALFFALFQGSGVPERPPGEEMEEVRSQLDALRSELDTVERRTPGGH